MGAGLAGTVAVPAAGLVLFPLHEDVTSGGGEFVVVGDRDQFGEIPRRVEIFADRKDAWNRVNRVRIGAAFVVERGGTLSAFTTVCPHLGCGIDFDESSSCFKCPCHRSSFDLDGALTEGPAPRGLDALELEDREGSIAVMYQRFRQGVAQKETLG
jgi:Rieske Fe-S protein